MVTSVDFDDLSGRLRGLLIGLDDVLTKDEAAEVEELLDHAEFGEALRALAWIIVEEDSELDGPSSMTSGHSPTTWTSITSCPNNSRDMCNGRRSDNQPQCSSSRRVSTRASAGRGGRDLSPAQRALASPGDLLPRAPRRACRGHVGEGRAQVLGSRRRASRPQDRSALRARTFSRAPERRSPAGPRPGGSEARADEEL
jgi:hypothetical protein